MGKERREKRKYVKRAAVKSWPNLPRSTYSYNKAKREWIWIFFNIFFFWFIFSVFKCGLKETLKNMKRNMCKLNVKMSVLHPFVHGIFEFSISGIRFLYDTYNILLRSSRVLSSIVEKNGSIRRKIVARWIQSCQCGSVIVSKRFLILVIYAVLHSACERCKSVVPPLAVNYFPFFHRNKRRNNKRTITSLRRFLFNFTLEI